MNTHRENRSGFVKQVLMVLIALIILSVVFKIDLRKVSEDPQFKQNVDFVEEKVVWVWDEYLSKPIKYVWNNIFAGIVAKIFTPENLDRIRNAEFTPPEDLFPSTEYQEEAPQ